MSNIFLNANSWLWLLNKLEVEESRSVCRLGELGLCCFMSGGNQSHHVTGRCILPGVSHTVVYTGVSCVCRDGIRFRTPKANTYCYSTALCLLIKLEITERVSVNTAEAVPALLCMVSCWNVGD